MIFKSKLINIVFWLFIIGGFLYGFFTLSSKFSLEILTSLHLPSLLIAIVFSVFGFFFQSISWWISIKEVGGHNYRLSKGITDHGITIFVKYIPGKILSTVGRAVMASNETGLTKKESIFASVNNLILSISVGFCCSIIILFILGGDIWTLIKQYNDLLPYIVAATIIMISCILYYYSFYIKNMY